MTNIEEAIQALSNELVGLNQDKASIKAEITRRKGIVNPDRAAHFEWLSAQQMDLDRINRRIMEIDQTLSDLRLDLRRQQRLSWSARQASPSMIEKFFNMFKDEAEQELGADKVHELETRAFRRMKEAPGGGN